MTQILSFIDGRKTYFFGAGLLAYGVYEILNGHADSGVAHIMQAGTILGLRHAISKGK